MSVSNKIKKLESNVESLKTDVRNIKTEISSIKERNVVDDLTQERFQGSGKPLYTYEEIGSKNGVSSATVARIAEKNNISRREKKLI